MVKWLEVILNDKTKKVIIKFIKGQKSHFENINARACLIKSDPEIGKTFNFKIKRLSDFWKKMIQRNKSIIQSNVGFLFNNITITFNNLKDINIENLILIDWMSGKW